MRHVYSFEQILKSLTRFPRPSKCCPNFFPTCSSPIIRICTSEQSLQPKCLCKLWVPNNIFCSNYYSLQIPKIVQVLNIRGARLLTKEKVKNTI